MSAVQNDTLKINHCVNRAAPVSIYRDWPASLLIDRYEWTSSASSEISLWKHELLLINIPGIKCTKKDMWYWSMNKSPNSCNHLCTTTTKMQERFPNSDQKLYPAGYLILNLTLRIIQALNVQSFTYMKEPLMNFTCHFIVFPIYWGTFAKIKLKNHDSRQYTSSTGYMLLRQWPQIDPIWYPAAKLASIAVPSTICRIQNMTSKISFRLVSLQTSFQLINKFV